MYQDTVTLFNRRRDKTGDTWYPTVLQGVDLNVDHAALVAKYGSSCNDKAVLHIRYGWHDGPIIGSKSYLTPLLWQAVADPTEMITFQSGESFDFFIEGTWPDEKPINDADWPGGFYNHLVRTRDGVYAVSAAAQYSVIPHFEVMGR